MTAVLLPARRPAREATAITARTETTTARFDLTPDQQFQGGLYCGSVHATPTTPISPTGLCPASQYGSTLVKIPVAGTEDDDHNPPRIASRNLFDLAVGQDNLQG